MLSVREIEEKDFDLICRYWFESDKGFLRSMGVDLDKMPNPSDWRKQLTMQISLPYTNKKSYCIIWEVNSKAIGHTNVNKIIFGEEAFMHLHIWNLPDRKKGFGTELIKMSIPYFFENLKLKKLYCEPYALNPAPNSTLEKLGFRFLKEYVTIPGDSMFEQAVKLWELNRSNYESIKINPYNKILNK